MALKQIILRQRIKICTQQLEALRNKDAEFETRNAALQAREAELEAAINEVTVDTPAEEQAVIDQQTTELETEQSTLETDKANHEDSKKKLEEEIQKLQAELEEIENRSAAPTSTPPVIPEQKNERTIELMSNRNKFGMTMEQRTAYLARPEVKSFYSRVRELLGQKRAITGGDLLIPDITLQLLRDNLHRYSKLLKHMRVVQVGGTSRQTIMGTIPEGVWTEACGKLNSLALTFTQIEVDGYKVGGYIAICNALLQDNDIALADAVEDALGQSIGLAVDKAFLYGTGTKMPVGIVTRLAQTQAPATWGANAPTWTDLHSTNLVSINGAALTDTAFFAALVLKAGIPQANYSNGDLFWAMSRKTYATLQSKAINFNAAGAIVAGTNMTMPIVGGPIEILDFIPENHIIGGYGSLYVVAERAGASLAVSDHVLFIEDQTVFKATARYDGMPVFGEGFVAIGIANSAPSTSGITFASDDANPQ